MTGVGQSAPSSFATGTEELASIADAGRARNSIPGGEHQGKAAGPQKPAAMAGARGAGYGPGPDSRAAKKIGRPARHEAPTAIGCLRSVSEDDGCDGGISSRGLAALR